MKSEKELIEFLKMGNVALPVPIHARHCRYWRQGKSHGPCICGARELGARLRQTLLDCGIYICESPIERDEREKGIFA